MKSGGGFNLYVFSFQKLGVDNHFSEYVWKRLKPPPCWHTTVYQVLNYHYNDQWDDWYERQLQVLGPISSSECLFNLSEWFLPSTAGNPKYICTQSTPNQCTVLMLFMSFVLWEQKVFFSCTFYAATIYIYTHIILVFHVVNVFFTNEKWLWFYVTEPSDMGGWIDPFVTVRASPALTSPRRPGNDWCMIGVSLKERALEIAVVLLAS